MARNFDRKRAAAGDDATIPPRDRFKCAAYGCPLPGAITDSIHGSDAWYCRKHFHAKSNVWQEITDMLRKGQTDLQ